MPSPTLTDTPTHSNHALCPKAKTLLCGGAGDPTVPPAVHQKVAKADFDARGLTNVSSVDVDPFVQAAYGPGGKAPTGPTTAATSHPFTRPKPGHSLTR